jgi:LemA protein
MLPVVIVVVVAVLVVFAAVLSYNRLIRLRMSVDTAWSQIAVQLERRHDLIPNLVETVKGYAVHERQTLEAVVQARNGAVAANNSGPAAQAQAENVLTGALRQLFALAEAYPDLKANQNFLSLQQELTSTEDLIANQRQAYNDSVMKYVTKIQSFPSNVMASMFAFKAREYFEGEPAATEVPRVQF